MQVQPVLLMILDGWGIREETHANAIFEAHPVRYNQLLQQYPHVALDASGTSVGLPAGLMGNSEVGHLNMGSGRVVYQSISMIDHAIEVGEFQTNPELISAMNHVNQHGSTLHLMGLVSDGGVHSKLVHLQALIAKAKAQGVTNLRVHAFLDGRDVPPKSAEEPLQIIETDLYDLEYPQIATICGRYYAMDRDKRWERVELAYDNLVVANGNRQLFSLEALKKSYNQDITDEFVLPAVCDITYEGMADNDAIIFFNFRPDRARQLTRALTDPNFDGFERKKVIHNLHFVCMTMYDETFTLPIAFPKQNLTHVLGQTVSEAGLKQFRTAETEKYAHVTYFLNGGQEAPFPGEDRKLIPSPKVATYDLQPEMSLNAVCDAVCDAVKSGQYQFIATNFANPDMVGHTGKLDAAIEAVKAVDQCIRCVADTALANNWVLLITADHGNIETMMDDQGNPHTAHTTNLVPLLMISNRSDLQLLTSTGHAPLSAVAPTVLDIMGLPKPAEMTTPSLLAPCAVPS